MVDWLFLFLPSVKRTEDNWGITRLFGFVFRNNPIYIATQNFVNPQMWLFMSIYFELKFTKFLKRIKVKDVTCSNMK